MDLLQQPFEGIKAVGVATVDGAKAVGTATVEVSRLSAWRQ
jgi:hypothetical protein